MSLGLATMNQNACSALECGGSSHRLPCVVHTGIAKNIRTRKAVAAAIVFHDQGDSSRLERILTPMSPVPSPRPGERGPQMPGVPEHFT